jgi:hypothetical protein
MDRPSGDHAGAVLKNWSSTSEWTPNPVEASMAYTPA